MAANATNECCEGEFDATFCQQTCEATVTQGSFFPACGPFLTRSQPPTCAGNCPPVESAVALGVATDGLFVVHSAAIRDDGLIAVVGAHEDAIDFGADALPAPSSADGQFLAVYAPDGSHSWAVSLGDGYPNGLDNPRPTFADAAVFDASGNVTVLVGLHAALDLGGTRTYAGVGAGADLGEGPITAMGATDSYSARFAPAGVDPARDEIQDSRGPAPEGAAT